MKQFLKSNYDIIYIVLALIFFILDLITRNIFFEGVTFLFIFIGFLFVLFNIINYPKDERINYIAFMSGYYSFMICLILVSIFSFLYRYFSIQIAVSDTMRYLLILMWSLFSLIYTLTKRKI